MMQLACMLWMWKRRILSYSFSLRSSLPLALKMGKEKKSYYAVRHGRNTGVYTSWDECRAQVNGFSGAVFKGFSTKSEAEMYAKTTEGYSAVARSTYSRGRGRGRAGRYSGKGFSEAEDYAIPTRGYSAVPRAHSRGRARGRGRAGRYSGKGFSTKAGVEDYAIPTGGYSTVPHSRRRGRGRAGRYSGKGFSTTTEVEDYAIPTAVAHGRGRGSNSGAHTTFAEDFTSGSRARGSRQTHSRCYSCGGQSSRHVVYSDGSCFGNGYKGAYGGLGVFWGDNHPYNVSEKLEGHQTNQRAELVSACRALETAIQQGYSEIELRTDSIYTIKSITEWIPRWRKNGWKTALSKPVKNQEDIERLDRLCQQVNVKWTHVPGHGGIHGNEVADHLAKAGSQKDT